LIGLVLLAVIVSVILFRWIYRALKRVFRQRGLPVAVQPH
jgi:hypothetical protein